ncbi:MAG: CHAT domain-containing protein [Gemmataceae bacterium]|nr:CHAT domain-containing protein [Gemmataceae bacterium]MCI0739018.1 CHAT domain-containing protein [Gemmataceae bacterium]
MEAVRILGVPAHWTELKMWVLVSCEDMEFAEGKDSGSLLLRRFARPAPCRITGLVRPSALGKDWIEVKAYFFFNGRLCGAGRKCIATQGAAEPKQIEAKQANFSGPAPTLTVVIELKDRTRGRLHWTLSLSEEAQIATGLPALGSGNSEIGAVANQEIRAMVELGSKMDFGDHVAYFHGLGEKIYRLTPALFQKTYWALHDNVGSDFAIQFITNEPSIPWELMRPSQKDRAGGLLALDHPVGRWLLDPDFSPPFQVPLGHIAVVAPEYDDDDANDPDEPVPSVMWMQELAKDLEEEFQAKRFSARRADLLELLEGKHNVPGKIAVFLFAGHGTYGVETAGRPIVLSRVRLERKDQLTYLEVDRHETTLGRKDGTFVIFNACDAGALGPVWDGMGGWADAFLRREFSGFLAPIWPVFENDTPKVIKQFLLLAFRGVVSLGEALRQARLQDGQTSPSTLAFLYYGDVLARAT